MGRPMIFLQTGCKVLGCIMYIFFTAVFLFLVSCLVSCMFLYFVLFCEILSLFGYCICCEEFLCDVFRVGVCMWLQFHMFHEDSNLFFEQLVESFEITFMAIITVFFFGCFVFIYVQI